MPKATLTYSDRFEALDSWRGICAILVALLHFDVNSHISEFVFLKNAFLFVDFFFVLSGFVIAANYQTRIAMGFGIRRFMLLRFGRVYPLYAVTLLAFVGFELIELAIPSMGALGSTTPFAAPQQSPDTIIASALMLQSFGIYNFLPWNNPSWSVATEFWTYLVFALTVSFVPRSFLFLTAATLIAAIGILIIFSERGMDTTYDLGMVRCLAGFSAGVLAYALWSTYVHHWVVSRFASTSMELAIVLAVYLFVRFLGYGMPSIILAPLVFAAAVLVFAMESGYVSSLLRLRPFLWLGALSYSIYMMHLFVERRLFNLAQLVQLKLSIPLLTVVGDEANQTKLLGTTPFEGDLWCIFLGFLLLGVATLTYLWVEVPGRQFFRTIARHVKSGVSDYDQKSKQIQ